MASDIRIRIGAVSAMVTLNASDAQVAAALTRYAASLGIPTTGTPTENLTAILVSIIDEIKRRSKQQQANELRAANEAAIQSAVESENAL